NDRSIEDGEQADECQQFRPTPDCVFLKGFAGCNGKATGAKLLLLIVAAERSGNPVRPVENGCVHVVTTGFTGFPVFQEQRLQLRSRRLLFAAQKPKGGK